MLDFRVKNKAPRPNSDFSARRKFLVVFMMGCMALLVSRAVYLQVFEKEFLKDQGDDRHVDEVAIPAYRGMIKDRNGAPLAVSTPVESIAINPKELKADDKNRLKQMEKEFRLKLAIEKLTDRDKAQVLNDYRHERALKLRQMDKLLKLPAGKITALLNEEPPRPFAYIARRIDPGLGEQVKELKLAGVYFEREFKRFYPAGGVSAHLVGFTDVEEVGQGGLELGYEKVLKGIPGSKRVIREDRKSVV